jgi:starch synthase
VKVLFVASEVAPLVKVGGLADVVGSLPEALIGLGHDVRVLIPQYGSIDTTRFPAAPVLPAFRFNYPGGPAEAALNEIAVNGVPVYTLQNPPHFGSGEVYGTGDLERFYFFSRAVYETLPRLEWQPEIVHCHDWLTALAVMWLKKSANHYATVFTIHNLAYQGFFDENFRDRNGLRKDWSDIPPGAPAPPLSFMAQAILRADRLTAVSETYAREITTPEYGVGLDALLRYREGSLTGIVNGLDSRYWDPQTDEYLPVNFNSAALPKRALNKVALQKVAGLPVNADIPLVGMVQRLDEQKGLDILGPALEAILGETGAQVVVLGRGQDHYEDLLRQIAGRHPQQVAAFIAFAEPLAHLIYAGCDMFLMPSHFEPCGLGQLIAMRYGALPVVRHTGGLVDTVPRLSADLARGNGFVFHDYTPEALAAAVREAAAAYRNRDLWRRAVQRVSSQDFSWKSSAMKYGDMYGGLVQNQKGLRSSPGR